MTVLPLPSRAVCLVLTTVLGGCVLAPPPASDPQTAERTEIALPAPPKRALTVGIYSCADTSGQRRPSGQAQELSTALPMDCTPYMIDAVRSLAPGYLSLVERQHVDELLRERQIATLALNTAAQAAAPGPAGGTPPGRRLNTLRVAEVLLIGQVVAYDRETTQAGAGFALGGVGATGNYVTDIFTFSIRAVAVQTGDVLGQTTVTKSITSLKLGTHDTKIWPTTVMEAELGGAANEPVGLALGLSVRSALTTLVQRGIKDGWWHG